MARAVPPLPLRSQTVSGLANRDGWRTDLVRIEPTERTETMQVVNCVLLSVLGQ